MDAADRQCWAQRAIRAVNATLPAVEHANWPQWERLLAHAQACTEWIEPEGLHLQEVAAVLQQAGWYLTERARYSEAEPLLAQAYQMSEQEQGAEHLDTARDALTLAYLYRVQGKYEQAEPLHVRALAIYEQQLGPLHPDTAQSLNNLAGFYHKRGRDEEAEPLFRRALTIREQTLGPDHPDTALSYYWLAFISHQQHHYEAAEPFYQRALSIWERLLGPHHPQTSALQRDYVSLLRAMGRDAEAVALEMKHLPPS
jgi:tetratricopeptide (TPR) repeat protein